VRSRQEATSHWRRDIKTPALQQINLETAKRNNYSSDNQLETCWNRESGRNNARGIYWKLPSKPEKGTCPISVINITDEQVMIPTLVTIEELPEDVTPDTAEKHMAQRKGKDASA